MKIKNTSADFVKNISLFFLITMVGTIDAMALVDNKSEPSLLLSSKEFVRQFPFMTMRLAHWKYENSTIVIQKQIDQKIAHKKDECLSMLFTMAVKVPRDMQLLIANHLFDNNEIIKDIFLRKTPIKKLIEVVELFPWIQDIHKGRAAENFMTFVTGKRGNFRNFQDDFLLKYSYEIKKIDECFRWHSDGGYHADSFHQSGDADYDTLKAISILKADGRIEKMYTEDIDIRYRYYNTYTWANFIAAFKEEFYDSSYRYQWESNGVMYCMKIFSTAMISSLLSRLVALNFCQKIIDRNIAGRNWKAGRLNELINGSEDAALLSEYLQPIQDPMTYSKADDWKILLPSFFPVAVLYQQSSESNAGDHIFVTLVGGFFSSFFCGCLNLISHNYISDKVLFIGSAVCSSLMAGYIVISTLMRMRTIKRAEVALRRLDILCKEHCKGNLVIVNRD